jgi:hypothetical protein
MGLLMFHVGSQTYGVITMNDYLSALTGAEIAITTTATLTINRQHLISGTSADYTVTLPAASGNADNFIGIRISPVATKLFTLDGNGSEKIDEALTKIMWAGESAMLYCDGSNWFKVAGKTIPMTAKLYLGTTQSLPNSTLTVVFLDTVASNPTGLMANTANNRIDILRPGKYEAIVCPIWCDAGGGAIDNPMLVDTFIDKSGTLTEVSAAFYYSIAAIYPNFTYSGVFDLVAGDYLRFRMRQTGSGTQGIYGDASLANGPANLTVIEYPTW